MGIATEVPLDSPETWGELRGGRDYVPIRGAHGRCHGIGDI